MQQSSRCYPPPRPPQRFISTSSVTPPPRCPIPSTASQGIPSCRRPPAASDDAQPRFVSQESPDGTSSATFVGNTSSLHRRCGGDKAMANLGYPNYHAEASLKVDKEARAMAEYAPGHPPLYDELPPSVFESKEVRKTQQPSAWDWTPPSQRAAGRPHCFTPVRDPASADRRVPPFSRPMSHELASATARTGPASAVPAHTAWENTKETGDVVRISSDSLATTVIPHLRPVQLRLSDISVVGLDAAVTSVTAAPIFLRGLVSGTPLLFSTDPVWPRQKPCCGRTRAPPLEAEKPSSPFWVSWPSYAVEDIVEIPFVASAGEPKMPQSQLVFEFYAAIPARGAASTTGLVEFSEEELYIGRCQCPLEDLGECVSPDSPRAGSAYQGEMMIRDGLGSPVGFVHFRVELRPLGYRMAQLSSLAVVMTDPQRRRGPLQNGARSAQAFLPEGKMEVVLSPYSPVEVRSRNTEGALSVTAAADSRTPSAMRWTSVPPVSFYEAPAFRDGRADDAREHSKRQQALLLQGRLVFRPCGMPDTCDFDERPLTKKRIAAKQGITVGIFSVPSSPPLGVVSATSYAFEVPLQISAEGLQWLGWGDWCVRGIAETWIDLPLDEAAQRMVKERRDGAVPHPPATPAPMPRSSSLHSSSMRWSTSRPLPSEEPCNAKNSEEWETTRELRRGQPMGHRFFSSSHGVAVACPSCGEGVPRASASFAAATPSMNEETLPTGTSERQAALMQRVEQRLASVQQRRRQLYEEMTAQAAKIQQEEGVLTEEYGQLEKLLRDAEKTYWVIADRLSKLRAIDLAHTTERQLLQSEAARERQEALDLRQQLEDLRGQLAQHSGTARQSHNA